MKKLTILFAPLLALVLAACSTESEPQRTVYGLVSVDDALTTLATAIETAELDGALDGDGAFTLFAPTDDALAEIIETVDGVCENGFTVNDLLASELLDDILLYHVVPGTVLAEDVVALDGQTISTLLDDLGTDLDDPGLTIGADEDVTLADELGQTVPVIQTDLEATNGVVHLIDGVLVPVDSEALGALCPAA
jgi:uncharacterized surface protein with fasciclin (FAS1) repeats